MIEMTDQDNDFKMKLLDEKQRNHNSVFLDMKRARKQRLKNELYI